MKGFIGVIFAAALAGIASAASGPMVGNNECTYGPSFWCASAANAKKCDFKPADCKKYCQDAKAYPAIQNGDICKPAQTPGTVGGNPCTWGPSFWCDSKKNAFKCDFPILECTKYCANATEYPDIQSGDICNGTLATKKCREGPSYWCASKANAKECDFPTKACKPYCKNATEYPDIQSGNVCNRTNSTKPPGSNPCTQGPSYWCANSAHLKKCGMKAADCEKYCADAKQYPSIQNGDVCKPAEKPLGSNKCTYGPSYWCASKANAAGCGFKPAECAKYCKDAKNYAGIQNGDLCKSL